MQARRRVRRRVGLTVALAFVAGIVLLPASPAGAHARLLATSPANGAELDEPPTEVRMRFTGRVTVAPDGVILRAANGAIVAAPPAFVTPADPSTVVLPVPGTLPDGGYVVSFRLISDDSHPVAGVFAFGVGAAAPVAEPGRVAGDAVVPVVFVLARLASYAGLALFSGGLVILLVCWPGGWANQRARRVVTAGWAASLTGAVGVLLLQGPYSAGTSLVDMAEPARLAATLDTDYGVYVTVRLCLVLAAAILVIGVRRVRPSRVDAAAVVTLGLALPATWVGTGHANTSDNPLDTIVDVAHLAAMSTWFGGLVLLAVCLLPRSAAALDPAEVGQALRRFSLLATGAVATLVVTGVYAAWRRVGTLEALVGTPYGRLLAFKVATIGVLVGLGAMSSGLVRRHFAAPPAAGAAESDGASRSRRRAARSARKRERAARARLGQSVRLETGLAAAVLAVAAILVATPPGVVAAASGTRSAARSGPVLEQAAAAGGTVRVLVDPAWVGDNRVVVEVLDAAGEPWDVPELGASFLPPNGDLGPLPVALSRTAPGVYQATGTPVPFAGRWRLRVSVRTTEIDQEVVNLDVPVS